MFTIFCDSLGQRREAVLLAVTSNQMRVAIRGVADAVQFTRVHEQWIGEDGQPVEIESVVLPEQPEWAFVACRWEGRFESSRTYQMAG